jgi:hypothetical protein
MSAGQNPNCIGCERSFCYPSTSTGPQRLAIVTRSHLRVGKASNCGSFGPPSGLPVFGRIKARRVEARELLAPIYGWFNEGFDTPVLQDAKELLDQLA